MFLRQPKDQKDYITPTIANIITVAFDVLAIPFLWCEEVYVYKNEFYFNRPSSTYWPLAIWSKTLHSKVANLVSPVRVWKLCESYFHRLEIPARCTWLVGLILQVPIINWDSRCFLFFFLNSFYFITFKYIISRFAQDLIKYPSIMLKN